MGLPSFQVRLHRPRPKFGLRPVRVSALEDFRELGQWAFGDHPSHHASGPSDPGPRPSSHRSCPSWARDGRGCWGPLGPRRRTDLFPGPVSGPVPGPRSPPVYPPPYVGRARRSLLRVPLALRAPAGPCVVGCAPRVVPTVTSLQGRRPSCEAVFLSSSYTGVPSDRAVSG